MAALRKIFAVLGVIGACLVAFYITLAVAQSNPTVQWQSVISTINAIQSQLATLQTQVNTQGNSGGGGTISGCINTVTLSGGTGTDTASCVAAGAWCGCHDSTTPANACGTGNPTNGSVSVTGTGTDQILVFCTTQAALTAVSPNLAPAMTGNLDFHGFNAINVGALTGPSNLPYVTSSGTNVHLGGAGVGVVSIDNAATLSSGAFGAGSIANFPDNRTNWQGGTDTCPQTWHNYNITANSTLTLNCPLVPIAGAGNPNVPLEYNIFQPAQGSTFTLTVAAANGATIVGPSTWTSVTSPPLCTTNGCLDQLEVIWAAPNNTYSLKLNGQNLVSSTSGSSSSCPGGGTAYYFSQSTGSDSNTGTQASPWQTISKAQTQLPNVPADGCELFKGGDTWTSQFDLGTVGNLQGTTGHPVTIGTYGTGKAILNESNTNNYGFDAIAPTSFPVKNLTLSNFEVKGAKLQAVTFQTANGAMPGITVQNFYIHDDGPGCAGSTGSCAGTSSSYNNQLDFEDSGGGCGGCADGVQFLNNVIKWVGGWNALEVHHDTGAVVVSGNTVGPGCVHGCLDIKGIGQATKQATVKNNVVTCGQSLTLCGSQNGQSTNPSPNFYSENVFSTQETVLYSDNVSYDGFVGFQDCPGNCQNGSGCGTVMKYYNNTVYIGPTLANSYAFYAKANCNSGVSSSGTQQVDIRNNIWDGGLTTVIIGTGFNSVTENYNDNGGHQGMGSGGFSVNGSSTQGSNDITSDPNYVNVGASPPNFNLSPGSPCINAGQSGLTPGNNDIGAF